MIVKMTSNGSVVRIEGETFTGIPPINISSDFIAALLTKVYADRGLTGDQELNIQIDTSSNNLITLV